MSCHDFLAIHKIAMYRGPLGFCCHFYFYREDFCQCRGFVLAKNPFSLSHRIKSTLWFFFLSFPLSKSTVRLPSDIPLKHT